MDSRSEQTSDECSGQPFHHAPDYEVFPPVLPGRLASLTCESVDHTIASLSSNSLGSDHFTLVCASWALVTSRITNANDVGFGAIAPDKALPAKPSTENHSLNSEPTPMFIRTERNQTVSELLQSTSLNFQLVQPSRLPHDDLPFQTVLIFRPPAETVDDINSNDSSLKSNYPFTIWISVWAKDWDFRAVFDPSVLERWIVVKLLDRVGVVLQQLVKSSPNQLLSSIDTMTIQDISQIWSWNRIVPAKIEQCFHDIFRARAISHGDAPAVDAWNGQLTYGKLDELSTRLAIELIRQGVSARDNPVLPLLFEKSMWTSVALLGVLKAGGAFLLLDPSLPQTRLENMVRQAKAGKIICSYSTQSLALMLVEDVIAIGGDFFAGPQELHQRLPASQPSSLMYVVFTSGSTGKPKCIQTTHSNVASALHHQLQLLSFTDSSRVFDFASYSFTTAICNITYTLAAGGCLCVPRESDRREKLSEAIECFQANMLDVTPSVARLINPEEVPLLHTLIFGGEYLQLRDVQRWEHRKIIHLYGQSECCSNGTINYGASKSEDALHIGWGTGLNAWIVDPDNHNILLPPGCVGELLFEGPLVTPGYLDDNPKTTLDAFIDGPSWLSEGLSPQIPGRTGRLYKTGDLVKYRSDGSLIILGRKDTQVKIRGQRVEVGEIEHWVRLCMPEASEVAVVVAEIKERALSQMLMCFLEIPNQEATELSLTPSAHMGAKFLQIPATVEKRLLENMPHYMVPTMFFSLPKLPVTATGKIDRKTLRGIGNSYSADELAQMPRTVQTSKEQPSSSTGKTLQRVWSKVLGVEQFNVGVDDNFFHLGGDSIAAMKAVGEARKLGLNCSVADHFRYPSLRRFAERSEPSVGELEERIPPFTLTKVGDIDQLLRSIASIYGLEPTSIEDMYSCTALQEGLMSLSAKRTGDYIMQEVLKLASDVSIRKVRAAWNQVARIKPILRTRIVHLDELGFMQVVLNDEVSWTDKISLTEYLENDGARSMGLGDPLTRFASVTESDNGEAYFVITIHHAICDGWSFRLIVEDFYRALQGLKVESGPQFQSFVKYTKEQDRDMMDSYWKKALQAYTPITFPVSPTSTQEQTAHQTIPYSFILPPRSSTDITLSTLARAAWALVLGRMADSEDVVFGVTVSGRNATVPGIEDLAAPTFATVPLRVKLNGHTCGLNYLRALQEQAVEMVPYEQAGLHNIARLSPDCQIACEFQSLLVFQAHTTETERTHVVGAWRSANQKSSLNSYALTLEIKPTKDRVEITATFDDRILEAWIVRKLLLRFEVLIQQLDSSGEKPLEDIDSIISQELQQIWEWNKNLPLPTKDLIHEVFRKVALTQPDRPAISSWDGELTYQELNLLSEKLAGQLADYGVKPNMLIPLCFEKSMWTPVAMLAVLKAGGGFALLDSALPHQRLLRMISQLGTEFILCSSSNLNLCAQLGCKVIEIGPNSFNTERTVTAFAQSSSTAMFAVFTSGSTGTPKAIVLSHSNFLSGLNHQSKVLGFKEDSRVFDYAGYSFDIAVHNTFAALVTGGCLCIPAENDRHDAERITATMAEMRVTIVDLTPSVARLIKPLAVPSLETLILAGEPVSVEDITPWWGKVHVVNAYGPAECNISTVNWQASKPQDVTGIGTGFGAVTWIVDPKNHERLLPPGCVGELILEGPIVGSGYLGDLERSKLSFIDSPKWLVNGAHDQTERNGRCGRIYKTGDLVRYLEDGRLAFMGRKDTQVKINGRRIELGEIESCLKELMALEHVLAETITLKGDHNRQILAAFVRKTVASSEDDRKGNGPRLLRIPHDVENRLSDRLPVYMRPSFYFEMDDFPVTPTGKTHRRRLREIGSSLAGDRNARLQTEQLRVSEQRPLSTHQHQMRMIWAKILCIDEKLIGAKDSFIQQGGDSISIMKLVSVLRKQGYRITVQDVLLRPKLEQVAQVLATSSEVDSNTIPKSTHTGPAELSFVQKRLWGLCILHLDPCWARVSWTTRLRGRLDYEALNAAISVLENRHDILRTIFVTQEGRNMQFVQDAQKPQLKIVDLSVQQGFDLDHVLTQDRTHPFDLGKYAGWRMTVYRLSSTEHVLSIVMHRMTFDGWSVGALRRDLSTFYSAAIHDTTSFTQVDDTQLQYRDYAIWQGRQNAKAACASQVNFWINHLKNCPAVTFPFDNPRPRILSGQTDTVEIRLEGALFDQVLRFQNEQDVTLFVVLIAAFRVTHFQFTGVTDAMIGTVRANRSQPETQDIIGPFEDVQCLRIKTGQEVSFKDLVRVVQIEAATAIANQDVSFDQIVLEGFPDADNDLSRHPLVQVIVVVHARSRIEVEKFSLERLDIEPMISPVNSRFDMEFHVYQEEESFRGVLVFSKDLYQSATAQKILSSFRDVLNTSLVCQEGQLG